MTTATHTAGRWTQCPACMAKDRMLDASAENYRRRIVDHAHCSPLEREREDVAYARYRLAFHEWERSVADHRAANGEETEAPAAEPAETEEAAQERPKVACVLFDAAYRLTTLVADTTDNPDAKAALAGIDALLFNLGYTDDDGRRFDKTAPADGEGEPK